MGCDLLDLERDVNMLVPSKTYLGGDISLIQVEEIVPGRRSKSITGFPRTFNVSPGQTSPSWTTAHGRGIVSATVGERSMFVIQPNDSFGNDRLEEQKVDVFLVYIYPEQADKDGLFPMNEGTIQCSSEGFFTVEYMPKTSGFHTIAAVQAVFSEQQQITTGYSSNLRGGTFITKLGNLSSLPISWDADKVALKNALDFSMGGISLFDGSMV